MIFISHIISIFIFVWTIWNSAPRYCMSLHGICSMYHKHKPDRIARWKRGISVTRISQKVCTMCFETPYPTEIIKKLGVFSTHNIFAYWQRLCTRDPRQITYNLPSMLSFYFVVSNVSWGHGMNKLLGISSNHEFIECNRCQIDLKDTGIHPCKLMILNDPWNLIRDWQPLPVCSVIGSWNVIENVTLHFIKMNCHCIELNDAKLTRWFYKPSFSMIPVEYGIE